MPSSAPFAGYRRLTQDRFGDKIGYEVQTKSGERAAAARGIVIGRWYEDADITAADEDIERPEFLRMLEDIRSGMWGGIVIFKIDRLTRMVFEYEQALRVVRRRKGFILSASSGVTTETQAGIGILRNEVSYAEQEIANLRERLTANKQVRSEHGLYHGGGHRPFGFVGAKHDKSGKRVTNTGKVGVKHLKAETDLLYDAAERIAWGGESYGDIIDDWHSRTPPVYGVTGAPWATKTLETILTSPRMIGRRVYRVEDPITGEVTESLVKAVWKPVLRKKTHQELCRLKAEKAAGPYRSGSDYVLSGEALCGRCERPLSGSLRKYMKKGELVSTRTYRCRSHRNDKARGSCGKLNVLADPAEKIVVAYVLTRLARSRTFAGHVADVPGIESEVARLDDEIADCSSELDQLSAANEDPSVQLRVTEYLAMRAPIQARLDRAMERREAALRDLKVPHPTGEDFADLPAWFESLTFDQRKALIRHNVKQVRILAPGRSGRYFDPSRVQVVPADAKDAA